MRVALALWALLAVAASTPAGSLRAQVPANSVGAAADSDDVVLPGDMIRLKIWREPEMSGDIIVDEGGTATFPSLGRLRVANLTGDSLKRALLQSYTKYLRDPAVDIAVLRRITVLGAVRTPNVYHIAPSMTVADALAMAGGASPEGKLDQVELRRRGGGTPLKLSRETRLANTPIRSGDELYVPQRSWLSRNAGLVLGGVGTMISILYFAFR